LFLRVYLARGTCLSKTAITANNFFLFYVFLYLWSRFSLTLSTLTIVCCLKHKFPFHTKIHVEADIFYYILLNEWDFWRRKSKYCSFLLIHFCPSSGVWLELAPNSSSLAISETETERSWYSVYDSSKHKNSLHSIFTVAY
jgi:hypothetical protein